MVCGPNIITDHIKKNSIVCGNLLGKKIEAFFLILYLRLLKSSFRLKLVTWNVGYEEPAGDFTDLLDLKADPLPDIYGIGLVMKICILMLLVLTMKCLGHDITVVDFSYFHWL